MHEIEVHTSINVKNMKFKLKNQLLFTEKQEVGKSEVFLINNL